MDKGYVYMMSNKRRGMIYIGLHRIIEKAQEHRMKLMDGFTKNITTRLVWVKSMKQWIRHLPWRKS